MYYIWYSMTADEYSKLKDSFMIELSARIKESGYRFEPQIIQKTNHSYVILLLNEAYELFCDGESAYWDFIGIVK